MLRAELSDAAFCFLADGIFVTAAGIHDVEKDVETALFGNTGGVEVIAEDVRRVNRAVGEDLDFGRVFHFEVDLADAGAFNGHCFFHGEEAAVFKGVFAEDFAGDGADNGAGELMTAETCAESELLVVLVAADGVEVVTLGVEEEAVHEDFSGLNDRRFAGTELGIDFLEGFVADGGLVFESLAFADILFEGIGQLDFVAEDFFDFLAGLDAEGTDEDGDGQLAVLVDTDVVHIVCVGFVFEPCAAVGDDGRGVETLTGLVNGAVVIDAGRTDDLGDDNSFRTVDDEGTLFGHEREVAHEDGGLFYFTGELVGETDVHLEGSGEVYVAFLAFFDGVFRLGIKRITDKVDKQVAGVVRNRGNIFKDFHKSLFKKPVE